MLTGFGKYCRKLRIDRDQTIEDMAKILGVTKSYLSFAETGKRRVPERWGGVIANLYKLPEEEREKLSILVRVDNLSSRDKIIMDKVTDCLELTEDERCKELLTDVVKIIMGE